MLEPLLPYPELFSTLPGSGVSGFISVSRGGGHSLALVARSSRPRASQPRPTWPGRLSCTSTVGEKVGICTCYVMNNTIICGRLSKSARPKILGGLVVLCDKALHALSNGALAAIHIICVVYSFRHSSMGTYKCKCVRVHETVLRAGKKVFCCPRYTL